jgi:hypothetical protein
MILDRFILVFNCFEESRLSRPSQTNEAETDVFTPPPTSPCITMNILTRRETEDYIKDSHYAIIKTLISMLQSISI